MVKIENSNFLVNALTKYHNFNSQTLSTISTFQLNTQKAFKMSQTRFQIVFNMVMLNCQNH
jgi:hypothetical protein